MNKIHTQEKCPVEITVHILANKWTIPIIKELLTGPKRPSDLERKMKALSAKTLSERLHDLQEWKILSRHSFPEVPPRVEYSLTPLGKQLEAVFEELRIYGERWQEAVEGKTGSESSQSKNRDIPDIASGLFPAQELFQMESNTY